jgi:hypothetical protein
MGVTDDTGPDEPPGEDLDQDGDDTGPMTAERASALIAKRIY